METRMHSYLGKNIPYRCTLKELEKKAESSGYTKKYLLAYIRYIGVQNTRFYMNRELSISLRGEEKIPYKIRYDPLSKDTFYEDMNYIPKGVNLISVDDPKLTQYLHIDVLCSLLTEGFIEIKELI